MLVGQLDVSVRTKLIAIRICIDHKGEFAIITAIEEITVFLDNGYFVINRFVIGQITPDSCVLQSIRPTVCESLCLKCGKSVSVLHLQRIVDTIVFIEGTILLFRQTVCSNRKSSIIV